MSTEPKARSHHHRKRRERAQKLPPEPSDSDMDQDGMQISPSRGPKDRSRSKPRKKKSSGAYEEDIIDGFAIVSFKSVEDLEVTVFHALNLLPSFLTYGKQQEIYKVK